MPRENIDYCHHCGTISSTMSHTYIRSPREYWLCDTCLGSGEMLAVMR